MTVRVVVVDDSPSMRGMIRMALSAHPRIRVVGEAGDPLQAREVIRETAPDVVTLDVEMPNMNGLEFLERLMRLRPTPVVMVSSLTRRGAEASLAALELGAVDCVAKPTSFDPGAFDALAARVVAAAAARVPSRAAAPEAPRLAPPVGADYTPGDRIIAVGASTGGVEALLALLSGFPANCPPTLVVQHMPAHFTASFAARLDRGCAASVAEAADREPLAVGCIRIAPGDRHLALRRDGEGLICRLLDHDPVSGHRPSVDVLFHSAAEAAGGRAVGAILTGMGRDGASGLLAMRGQGAATFAQDEASCVVHGMPRAACEIGAVDRELPLGRLAGALLSAARKGAT